MRVHAIKIYLKHGALKSLIPQLQPGNIIIIDIIIIDNATFHKADATPRRRQAQGNAHQAGQSIREIVSEAGCHKGYRFAYEIWYLPPYSPDLNKRCDPAAVSAAKERAPRQ